VGRSTNILNTFKQEMQDLSGGVVSKQIKENAANLTIINSGGSKNSGSRSNGEAGGLGGASVGALVLVVAWALTW